MADRGAISFGTTEHSLARLMSLPLKLVPALPQKHIIPTGFNNGIEPIVTGDVARAFDIYAGRFEFAGEVILSTPHEVFALPQGQAAWRHELLSLDWLRHFASSQRNLHNQHALRLLHYWSHAKNHKPSFQQCVKTTCALAIHGHSIAKRCERDLQLTFLKIVSDALRILISHRHRNAEEALDKAMAISYCLTAFQGLSHLQKLATDLIERNLDQVILLDGGHASGDIQKLITFLDLAQPLGQTKSNAALTHAVNRSLALLRLLQGADGKLSPLLNGEFDPKHYFAIGEHEIARPNLALQSGFARLDQGKATLIADTSSALSIDFSYGVERVFHALPLKAGQRQAASLQIVPQGQALLMQTSTTSRTIFLSADGNDLRIEDRFYKAASTEIKLLLPSGIRLSTLMEGQAIMLIMPDNTVWHLKQRGGSLQIGRAAKYSEIVIKPTENSVSGRINWSFKKQAAPTKPPPKKQIPSDLLI